MPVKVYNISSIFAPICILWSFFSCLGIAKENLDERTIKTEVESLSADSFKNSSDVVRIPYQILYENVPIAISKSFEQRIDLAKNQNKGFISERMALKYGRKNQTILEQEFRRHGYFDIRVDFEVIYSSRVVTIKYNAQLGERYKIIKCMVNIIDAKDQLKNLFEKSLAKINGTFVDFSKILSNAKEIKGIAKEEGFYFAKLQVPRIELNRKNKSVKLFYDLKIGHKVIISGIEIEDIDELKVPKKFVQNRIIMKIGDVLRPSLVNRTSLSFFETGLFSNIKIFPKRKKKITGDKEETEVKISLQEIPPRLVSVGGYYSATGSFLVSCLWNHKNFLNKAHNIGTSARIGTKEITATLFYDLPDVFVRNQKLHFDITAKHYNTKAFEGDIISATTGLLRTVFFKKYEICLSLLPTFESSKLNRPNHSAHKENLFGVKTKISLNLTNNKLHPSSGVLFNIGFDQFFGNFKNLEESESKKEDKANTSSLNKDNNILLNHISILTTAINTYIPLSKDYTDEQNLPCIASAISFGKIFTKHLECVPFDKRLYGGGRNNIRSYGYQMAGFLDENDLPIGGSSLLEACIEPRIRINQNWAGVFFIDWSCSFAQKSAEKNLSLWGAGIGIRYYTKFGPIRFDIALPLNRRINKEGKKVDRAFQYYLSVGHAL